jgi:hypothetical protein
MQYELPLLAKLAISFGGALVTSTVAMWYWSSGKGRLLQSGKSRAWLAANILVMALISTAIGALIPPVATSFFWLNTALLPATLAGSRSLEDLPMDGIKGGNPFGRLLSAIFDLASWLVAPLQKLLDKRMRHDLVAWVETIDGEHRPFDSWNWKRLRNEAGQLYESLCLYVADEPNGLGELTGIYDLVNEGCDLPAGAERDACLRKARTAYTQLRRLAYIWGYDVSKPAKSQSGKGLTKLRKSIAALKPVKAENPRDREDDV